MTFIGTGKSFYLSPTFYKGHHITIIPPVLSITFIRVIALCWVFMVFFFLHFSYPVYIQIFMNSLLSKTCKTPIIFLHYSPPNLFYSHHDNLIFKNFLQKLWDNSCLWAFVLAASSAWYTLPPISIKSSLSHFLLNEVFYYFSSKHMLPIPLSLLQCSSEYFLSIPNGILNKEHFTFFSYLQSHWLFLEKTNLHESRKLSLFC